MLAIDEANFSEYMRDTLYGKEGFYTKGGGSGRDRDYMTSPEVGDLFGYVIASYIDNWYDSLDDPDGAIVVEAGCGPGSLAASIARAQMRNAADIEYFLVDISPEHRETAEEKMNAAQPDFAWSVYETIPECDLPTLVMANELLDNLVFDIGRTADVYQPFETDRKPGLDASMGAGLKVFRDIDILGAANVPANIGDFRIPLHVGIVNWLAELMEATANVSDLSVLFLDYMKSVTEMEDENWMRLYSDNKRIVGIDHVFTALESGATGDITTDVIIEDLHVLLDTEGFSRITFTPQAQWLEKSGLGMFLGRVEETSRYDQLAAFVQGDNSAAQMSSFAREREILTDENGLGAFTVVTAQRAV